MNCKHLPRDLKNLLLNGDAGMVCRRCGKPIRTKDRKKADVIRKLLVIIPIVLFCIIAGLDFPDTPAGKLAIIGCFAGSIAISILGWIGVCTFLLEYEEVPEKAEE